MPLANPNRSFETAARHLFRHLHEPGRLRRNPLVRRIFEDGTSRMTRGRKQTALASIMRLVEQGIEECRRLDLEGNEGERAYRQSEIVRRTYFDRASIDDIASDLGLSIRQYYRERKDVTTRIARYVETARDRGVVPATFSRLDPLRFQMEQASHRAEMGDGTVAVSAFASLLAVTDAVATRIEVLCRLAEVSSEMGDYARAADGLRDAERLFAADAYELLPVAREAARCHISLVRSCVAWRSGEIAAADDALAAASRQLETMLAEGGVRVRELCAEVLLERARRHGDRGNFSAAIGDLARTDHIHGTLRDASLRQRSDAARLRALFGMTAAEPLTTAAEAVSPIADALSLARQCGSATRVVLANAAFGVLHRYSDEPGFARDAMARSVSMMRQIAFAPFQASIAVIVADALLQTPYWKRGVAILAGAHGVHVVGSGEWLKLQQVRSEYLLQLGKWSESYEVAAACEASARVIGSARYGGAALRCMALSVHFLGRSDEANELAVAAMNAVERHGSALSRSYTRRVATMIGCAPR